MYTYNDFPTTAKVWIYQSNRLLTDMEVQLIRTAATSFLNNWESHGSPVKGYIEVRDNAFVVVMADDSSDKMCGRAIDGSIKFVKELEQNMGIPFLDRMNTAWVDNNIINVGTINQFRDALNSGIITTNTVVFNNTITTKQEFENNWKLSMKNSWHATLL